MIETRAERDQREAIEVLEDRFQFLADDFGYTALGRVPVSSDEVTVLAYANRRAGVQAELSGHPPGVTFFGGLRRLRDGVPDDRDHFLAFNDIAMVRQPGLQDLLSHNLNPDRWRGVVDTAVQLLKDNSLLLTGVDWIPRERVTTVWNSQFMRKWGFPSGDDRWPVLTDFKSGLAFLLEHGYRLTYDTSTLTPHEYGVTKELRYESRSGVVSVRCVDFREDEWMVYHDGRPIGAVFRPSLAEIESRARLVAAALGL